MHPTHDQLFDVCKNSWLKDWHLPSNEDARESWCVNVTTTTIHICWKHIDMIIDGTLTLGTINTLPVIISHNVELLDVSMLLNILSQLSIIARDSKSIVTMSVQEYAHFEVEFNDNHPYVPTEEDILNILSALEAFEIIENDS